MVDATASSSGLTGSDSTALSIPAEGLDEVLRAWNGPGQLLSALAGVEDDEHLAREWSAADIRRRAHRVLFSEVESSLMRWPTRTRDWLRALPAESYRLREVMASPAGRVSWHETRKRFGWPPGMFVAKTRHRMADELLTRTLRWTIERMSEVRADAIAVAPHIDESVAPQLDLSFALLEVPPVRDSVGIRPSSADVRAVSRQGWPWTAVADVADRLRSVDSSVHEYARRLLLPTEELRPKLFHLAVLGQLLNALRGRGADIVSLRPLARTTSGPAFRIVVADGVWDLWFEAGAVWSHYSRVSPYLEISSVLHGKARPLSPDILLVQPDGAALILECKYSANADYVGGRGVTQVMAYAVESLTALAPIVVSRVIAPIEAITASGSPVPTCVGTVAVSDAHQFDAILDEVGIP